MWRGPAFGDVRSGSIRTAAEHLDSRRLLTAETKAETDLVLGRYATVVTELSAWLITHPLRERSLGLTMLALHRLGCRADALGLYQVGYQRCGRNSARSQVPGCVACTSASWPTTTPRHQCGPLVRGREPPALTTT